VSLWRVVKAIIYRFVAKTRITILEKKYNVLFLNKTLYIRRPSKSLLKKQLFLLREFFGVS
jgi:hypothetical protein